MRYLFPLFLVLLLKISPLQGEGLFLNRYDVKQTLEELLRLHVEHEELTPMLLGRAMRGFLNQFDQSKIYLLEEEAKAIFPLTEKALSMGLNRYHANDLSDFLSAYRQIKQVIDRSRKWRSEIEKELILSVQGIESFSGESYLSYAVSELQLKTRLKKQMVGMLMEEKRYSGIEDWTPIDRQNIFALCERRLGRNEIPYLAAGNEEEDAVAVKSLRALAKSLDAYTAYFSREEAAEMRISLEKQFEGIGVFLREGVDGMIITDLAEGGPAERSQQIQKGDRIIRIDGTAVAEMSHQEALEAMKGKTLHLELARGKKGGSDEKIFHLTLVRERIMMHKDRLQSRSVPYGDGQLGVLILPSFYEGGIESSAERDICEAIKKMKQEGDLKGIVLDLRENTGGFLTQAVKIAGLFISKGVIVISKYAKGKIKYLRNLQGEAHFDGPIVVLTSKASASAAEIVAQALQDYGAALVIGDEQTYGKGTIQYQTLTDKEAKAFYKVTVGRYYTVSGRSTQIRGVKADIVVPTEFASYRIGERYLEYPLPSDQVAAAYLDPLTDIDYRNRIWFQKNYLPYLYQPKEKWQKLLPQLRENSKLRLDADPSFTLFLKTQDGLKGRSHKTVSRLQNPEKEDLQMREALYVLQDMIVLGG